MKKLQSQKVKALTKFKDYCEENSLVWSLVVGFATAVTALGVKLQAIVSMDGQQEKNNKGVTLTKSERKRLMANSAVIVAQAIQGYATSIGDKTLFNLMQISFTSIFKVNDTAAVSKSELVSETATNLLTELGPFGISGSVISALDTVIENYISVQSSTGIVITNKKNYTGNLDTLIKEGNSIMRQELLKTGRQFMANNPDFYNGLVDCAKVITTVVHTKLKITVTITGDNPSPLMGCTVQIENTGLSGETDTTGKCTISSVPEGKQTIIISKLNYFTVRREQVQFNRGKSTTMSVALTPEFEMPAVAMGKKKVTA